MTIHASVDGIVVFSKKNISRFDGRKYLKTVVNIVPHGEEKEAVVAKVTEKLAPKAAKKTPAKKEAPAAKAAAPKAAAKKAPAKKVAEPKAKSPAKKTPAKKAPAKKPAAKKTK